jgi:hypothetical protein
VGRRFHEWLDSLDPALRAAIRESLVPWLGTALMALLLILVAGALPATGDFFQLDVSGALVVWALTFGFSIVIVYANQRQELRPLAYGVAILTTCAAVVLCTAAMISLSRPPGSSAIAAMFILAAAYYGHLYRMTVRFPFGWISLLVALLGAMALNRHPGNWMVFALSAPAAFGSSWLLGTMARRSDRSRAQREAYRAAVQAQILD